MSALACHSSASWSQPPSWVRIDASTSELVIRYGRGGGTAVIRWILAGVILFYMFLFVVELTRSSWWGPFSTADEQVQYYQAARNFVEYGFFTNYLLPDLSTASSASERPILYNHQPPGPQLFIATAFASLGENFVAVRALLGVLFFTGLIAYVKVGETMSHQGLRGAQLGLLFVAPATILHAVDHPAYAAVPFFAFVPILSLRRHTMTGNRLWLFIVFCLVFIATNYLIYGTLFMILAFWTVGALLRMLPVSLRHFALIVSAVASGVVVHLLQTVLVLGWRGFIHELAVTLSNRMLGVPGREEMIDFYRHIGFVLYGDHALSARGVAAAFRSTMTFPGQMPAAAAVLCLVGVGLLMAIRVDASHGEARVSLKFLSAAVEVLKMALWGLVAVSVPIVMFPAFASDYGLSGSNEFVLGLLVVPIVAAASAFVIGCIEKPRLQRLFSVAVGLLVIGAVVLQAREGARVMKSVLRFDNSELSTGFDWIKEHLSGNPVMTNVDPTVMGFFTREVAFGGCHLDSIDSSIKPANCRVFFVRRDPHARHLTPTAYIWFGAGNAFCRKDCLSREELGKRFKELFTNRIMAVFDLESVAEPS